MSWDLKFEDPVTLPDGKVIWTLREAGEYVAKLPKKESSHERWQTAMSVLLQAAERKGPVMHAHIGMMRALRKYESMIGEIEFTMRRLPTAD